jgi:S1-C subfamily serine protease
VDKLQRQSWLAALLAESAVKSAPLAPASPKSIKWAGLELVTISDFPDYVDASGGQSTGAFVVKLNARSKAAKAGFKNGDTIVGVGPQEVRTLNDLQQALKAQTGSVTVKVFRGYKHYNLTVKP